MILEFLPLLFKIPFLENTLIFVFTIIMLYVVIGMGSKSLAVASYAGFIMFITIVVNIDIQILTQSLYVGLVVIILVTVSKLYGMLFSSEGEI